MEVRSEITTLFPLNRILPVIIVIEGFVSIAIEILCIRQLLPVAGGSVIVTSLIIGFFLLSLALGYQQGGKRNANFQKVLRTNFFIAAIWFGIGLSYLFVEIFFYSIQKMSGPHILFPLIAYLVLVVAPLVYILGQTIPITMHMIRQTASAGKIGGNTLGLSTLGSFMGALVTTLICMYFFGVAWTIVINFLLLQFITILLVETRIAFYLQLFVTLVMTVIIYNLNIPAENSLFILTDNYANYQIRDSNNSSMAKGEKMLVINDGISSFINNEKHGLRYIELIKKMLFDDMKLQNADILVLGAGGFTVSAENKQHNKFTYVDIDNKIKKITVPGFIHEVDGSLIIDDARHYIQSVAKLYDVIISDAYSDVKAVPAHLLTYEYMQAIHKRLTANGLAIFNIVANPTLADPYSRRIDNTIRAVFSDCMVVPLVYANRATNIIYTCRNANQIDKQVYSDNLNNSATDSFAW